MPRSGYRPFLVEKEPLNLNHSNRVHRCLIRKYMKIKKGERIVAVTYQESYFSTLAADDTSQNVDPPSTVTKRNKYVGVFYC